MNTVDVLAVLESLDHGSVIRWTMNQRFTYVAIKIQPTPMRPHSTWYTTATWENTQVAQTMTNVEMANIIDQSLLDFEVATDWRLAE